MTHLFVRGAALALGVAVVVCCAILGIAATPHFGASAPAAALLTSFVPTSQHVFGKQRLRVLVVGLDYDYDSSDQETSAHSRSDIIMALHLDFARRRIFELSVPRDMVATLPDGRTAKINEAQSEGGIAESESVVSHWLGSPAFDRYVVLRIDTMKDLIDALGGITVNVKNSDALKHAGPNGPVDYDDTWGHLHVHLKPGVQHLTGTEERSHMSAKATW
jgi:LCP family protein required for cell wall assembly